MTIYINNKEYNEELLKFGYHLHKRGFGVWFPYMFNRIESTSKETRFIYAEAHKIMFDALEDVYSGKVRRLCINCPPRFVKSTAKAYFHCYGLITNPSCNVIDISYGIPPANDTFNKVRYILNSAVFQAMYPQTFIKEIANNTEGDKFEDPFWEKYAEDIIKREEKTRGNKSSDWSFVSRTIITSSLSKLLFTSIGSPITGAGSGSQSNISLYSGGTFIDDANKMQDMRSETLTEKVHIYYDSTIRNRMNNPSVTPIVNIQQRAGTNDLTGYLLKTYSFFQQIKIPLFIIENGIEKCTLPHQYKTKESREEVKIPEHIFLTQYQQEPTDHTGVYVELKDLVREDYEITIQRQLIKTVSVDMSFKAEKDSDYTAIVVFGFDNSRYYILDCYNVKYDIEQLKIIIANAYVKWRATSLLIEEAANGHVTIDYFRNYSKRTGSAQSFNVIPYKPPHHKDSKKFRMEGCVDVFKAGNFVIPKDGQCSWLLEYINQLINFPNVKNDDMVDSTTQFLLWNMTKAKPVAQTPYVFGGSWS